MAGTGIDIPGYQGRGLRLGPSTGTPEIGGLSTADAIQLLRGLRGLNFMGGDLVEVAPQYDTTTNTPQVGKQMLFEILCLVAESRARIVAGNSVS